MRSDDPRFKLSIHRHRVVSALFGASLQAARFRHSVFDQKRYAATIKKSWKFMEGSSLRMVSKFDEDAFVWSLSRLMVVLKTAKKNGVEVDDVIAVFATIQADAKTVRDMREHIDDYESLRGKRQSEFVTARNYEGYGIIEADSQWQIVIGKEFYLGNKLDFWAAENALHSAIGLVARREDFLADMPELREFGSKVNWTKFDKVAEVRTRKS